MTNQPQTREDGKILIFTPYITRKGKKIPPPNGKTVWAIWVDPDKKARPSRPEKGLKAPKEGFKDDRPGDPSQLEMEV